MWRDAQPCSISTAVTVLATAIQERALDLAPASTDDFCVDNSCNTASPVKVVKVFLTLWCGVSWSIKKYW